MDERWIHLGCEPLSKTSESLLLLKLKEQVFFGQIIPL